MKNQRFALDTLRVTHRSPTPASNINDFFGVVQRYLGGPGPPVPADFGVSRGPDRPKTNILFSLW